MIATWHAGPIARHSRASPRPPPPRKALRGSPLAMLGALLALWVAGRVLAWEDPVVIEPGPAASPQEQAAIAPETPAQPRRMLTGAMSYADPARDPLMLAGGSFAQWPWEAPMAAPVRYVLVPSAPPQWAYAHASQGPPGRYEAGYGAPPRGEGEAQRAPAGQAYPAHAGAAMYDAYPHLRSLGRISAEDLRLARAQQPVGAPGAVPFGEPQPRARRGSSNRWSLDGWAFLRQGSEAAAISQGRVPIYGASQIGAIAQWRARPGSRHDPRLYARAYSALVSGGETELAAGGSIRPIPSLPVRAAGEVRVTESPFSTDIRPAGYLVTELAPFRVIEQVTGELYAGGGYVGGEADTAFFDGQFALTRRVIDYTPSADRQLKLSLGAGAWGGAQRGASRLDIGPTMRLDMLLGKVPARVSLDWRERVDGDAAPDSGVAATVSASF